MTLNINSGLIFIPFALSWYYKLEKNFEIAIKSQRESFHLVYADPLKIKF